MRYKKKDWTGVPRSVDILIQSITNMTDSV